MSYLLVSKLPIHICSYIESYNINYKTRYHTPLLLIEKNCLDGLKWLYKYKKNIFDNTIAYIDKAVEFGNVHMVSWLYAHKIGIFTHKSFDIACYRGDIDMVSYLHFNINNISCTTDAVDNAAANGHLHILKFIHTYRNERCTTDAMDFAILHNHEKVVKWLIHNRYEGCSSIALKWAAKNNNVFVFKYICKTYNYKISSETIGYIIQHENISLLKWCFEKDKNIIYSSNLYYAFYYECNEIINFLLTKQVYITLNTMLYLIQNNKYKYLVLLIRKRRANQKEKLRFFCLSNFAFKALKITI